MIKALKYILFIIYGLLIVSCNTVDPNDSDLNEYHTVSGTVWDYVNNNSPNRKEAAPVVIDEDTSVSNAEGEFYFDKVLEGSHIISVSLPNYEYYADTINVISDTVITIPIFGVKDNYFPIQVNTQKRYEYHSGSAGGLFWVSDSGEVTWNIYSFTQQGENLVYNVAETLIYVRTTQIGGTFPPDTVVTEFKFIEDESNVITIQSSIWDGISFNRYFDPREGDIIQYNFYRTHSVVTIYLKRNVGLSKLKEEDNLYLSGTTYELIE
ncbi:MAG: hypothetical protein IH618_07155 [Ignavibacteriaceae bacterium]|nr:hypothetical protein [Ignavibacteriaceae bacterium]